MIFVPVRHDQYYLESVIFLVEDALFKVPRYPFERNAVFATVFSLPVGQHGVAEGVNDENPFKLEGISKVDFVNFLRVVYPMNMISYEIDMGVDAWISVLKLSTMWDFVETRRLAIQQLSKLGIDLVSKVLLGKQYRVQEWLFNAYEGLAKRMEPISVDEARRLGLETAIRIYQIREEGASEIPRRRAHRNTPDNRGFGNLDSQTQHYLGAGRFLPMPTHEEVGPIVREQDDYSQKIRREFVEELKEVEEQEIAETIR